MSDPGDVDQSFFYDHPLLLLYISKLRTRLRWLSDTIPDDDVKKRSILEEVSAKLKADQVRSNTTKHEASCWTEAYSAERLLALVSPSASLGNEIRRRLDEADAEQVAAAPRLRLSLTLIEGHECDRETQGRDSKDLQLRGLLLEVLEEIHYTKTRKFYSRPLQKMAGRGIAFAAIVSFMALLIPYAMISYQEYYSHSFNVSKWSWLPTYSALTAGLFGAYFSRIMFIQRNIKILSLGELRYASQFWSIVLRGCFGMCGALVVYFFLQSHIVSGNLFPEFKTIGIEEVFYPDNPDKPGSPDAKSPGSIHLLLPSKDLALLIVWCFLAGFSERLVPSILSTTEGTLGSAARTQK